MSEKGFAFIPLIITLVVIAAVGGYLIFERITAPRCDYASCDDIERLYQEVDMSTWQTYRNEQYGFEVKYPSTWTVRANPTFESELIIKNTDVRDGVSIAITSDRPLIGNDDVSRGISSSFQIGGLPAKEIYHGVGQLCDGGGCLDIPERLLWTQRGEYFYTFNLYGTIAAAVESEYGGILSEFKFISPSAQVKPRIIDYFACSDYCPKPAEEYTIKVYEDVTDETTCKNLGGTIYTYYGWGKITVCKAQ